VYAKHQELKQASKQAPQPKHESLVATEVIGKCFVFEEAVDVPRVRVRASVFLVLEGARPSQPSRVHWLRMRAGHRMSSGADTAQSRPSRTGKPSAGRGHHAGHLSRSRPGHPKSVQHLFCLLLTLPHSYEKPWLVLIFGCLLLLLITDSESVRIGVLHQQHRDQHTNYGFGIGSDWCAPSATS
jgi:hypothetical protein